MYLSHSNCCSYQWIKRKGRPAPREIAPIVVSNHVSYIDPIFFFYELFPTIVASESHDSMPFVGTIIRAMQVILHFFTFCKILTLNFYMSRLHALLVFSNLDVNIYVSNSGVSAAVSNGCFMVSHL